MSVQAITWAYDRDGLALGPKAALVALANFADGDGVCFPGQVRLARMIGASERATRDYLAQLEAAGFITREQRRRGDGSRTSDLYRLNMLPADPAGSRAEPTGRSRRANRQISPGQPADPAGHEPSVEPSEEPSAPPYPPAETDRDLDAEIEAGRRQVVSFQARTHDHAVLMTSHPAVWSALGAIATARSWGTDQTRTVARKVLELVRDHGDKQVIAGLAEIRANAAEIRMPIRWLERALQARAAETQAADQPTKRARLKTDIEVPF